MMNGHKLGTRLEMPRYTIRKKQLRRNDKRNLKMLIKLNENILASYCTRVQSRCTRSYIAEMRRLVFSKIVALRHASYYVLDVEQVHLVNLVNELKRHNYTRTSTLTK